MTEVKWTQAKYEKDEKELPLLWVNRLNASEYRAMGG